jgi:hypothetical protein
MALRNLDESGSSSEGGENPNGIEADLSGDDDDLTGLNNMTLQKKMSSEVKLLPFRMHVCVH